MRPEAVIFDMDGLILDTEPLYRAAWQRAAAQCGYSLTDALYAPLVGRKKRDAEQILVSEFGPQFPIDSFRSACEIFETLAFTGPIPKKLGLDDLLNFLDSRHVPKAVATSASRQLVEQLLANAGLLKRFDAIATSDEVPNGKPAPDIFLLAARRLNAAPSGCLVLEDSQPGVQAAYNAGMKVFLVPDGNAMPAPGSARRVAHRTFASLTEVARHLAASSVDGAHHED